VIDLIFTVGKPACCVTWPGRIYRSDWSNRDRSSKRQRMKWTTGDRSWSNLINGSVSLSYLRWRADYSWSLPSLLDVIRGDRGQIPASELKESVNAVHQRCSGFDQRS